jgi:hypothetical protein
MNNLSFFRRKNSDRGDGAKIVVFSLFLRGVFGKYGVLNVVF